MKYLLDTCCISDFVRGDKNTLAHIKSCAPYDLALSSITVMELEYGLLHNSQRAKKIRTVINDFISCLTIFPYTETEAQHSAAIRASLRQAGTPIGSYDVLIAGTALSHELTLVTANEKEFKRIPDLKIENWR